MRQSRRCQLSALEVILKFEDIEPAVGKKETKEDKLVSICFY